MPLFCQPFNGTLGLVLVAVALGGAEGALDYFRQRMTSAMLPRQGRVQALDPSAQMDLAESTLQIRSARLLLKDACHTVRAVGEQFGDLTSLELADLRVAKAYIVRQCTAAVDRLFAASGGGALQETHPLQRYLAGCACGPGSWRHDLEHDRPELRQSGGGNGIDDPPPLVVGLNGMLWFTGAVERDPSIDVWLNEQAPDLGAIARRWFAQMRACGDDVRELMHDGCPVACVGDAPFGYVNVFRAHVNVGFFLGAELEDPAGLLEGSGRRMRHVKVRPGADLNFAA